MVNFNHPMESMYEKQFLTVIYITRGIFQIDLYVSEVYILSLYNYTRVQKNLDSEYIKSFSSTIVIVAP